MDSSEYFRSLNLSPSTREQIDSEVQAIRANNIKSLRLRIENGQHCLNIKRLIGHGDWLTWLVEQSDAGYRSPRTVEREMALAEHLYPRMGDLQTLESMTSATALYELCRAKAPGEALEAAFHLMEQGLRITGPDAQHLTHIYEVAPELGDRVRAGDITLADAAAVAERLDQLEASQQVVSVVVEHGVRAAGVVEALAVLHKEHPERFAEVAASGTVWNPATEVEVPLAEASRADGLAIVNAEDAEREARRQQHIMDWKSKQPGRLGMMRGRRADLVQQLADLIPDDGNEYAIYVYPVGQEAEPAS